LHDLDKVDAHDMRNRRNLAGPEVRSQLESLGFDVVASTPEEYTAFEKRDMAKWAKALEDAGIKPE
jgi:hypothetical protein